MTLQQLQYFQMMSKVLHYTKAAQLLHISQPSLSYSLAELEREMGVSLFEKDGKKIHLSWYGEIFLGYVERALGILDEGVKKIHSFQSSAKGSVRLGYFHSISSTFIPALVNRYYKDAGNTLTSFYFMMEQHQLLMKALKSGEIDLAICPYLDADSEIAYRPIWTQELFLVVPNTHPLSKHPSVPLNVVDKASFIAMDKQSGIRHSLEKIFKQAGVYPNYTFEANECTSALTYVSLGLGIAILPKIPELHNDTLSFIKISDPVCERKIHLAWMEGHPMTTAVLNVRDYILARSDISLEAENLFA